MNKPESQAMLTWCPKVKVYPPIGPATTWTNNRGQSFSADQMSQHCNCIGTNCGAWIGDIAEGATESVGHCGYITD